MRPHRDSKSLAGQVVAANVLMVVATLFAASAAAHLNLTIADQRVQFGLLGLSIVLVLLVNMLMLRRRFSPLDRLIERVEAIDPAEPTDFEAPEEHDAAEEIDRLAASFRRMLRRIDDERKRSGRMVLRAQEEERRRLARDLHDEVNQSLTAILLRLEALSHAAPPELDDEVGELKRLVNQAMDELLNLARQLRPSALDDHGLTSAIVSQVRRFSSQTGIKAEIRTSGERIRLESDQEIAVYRFAQEALSNIAQHAEARHVEVGLSASAEGVELSVSDDGRGFDPHEEPDGIGLSGMAERARLVGARFEVSSRPGGGTAVTLQVP
ncbi:MAG: two-component system, NarL family, sensor histidine kinase UhpB [Thermoleophilaceae bacterium]|jgi:two-component system sensor histidine kinase UhpB|nr:two-component system, NarL family, sensor histidine kinase UhpB [Thermoleophilaceae bacterium]